MSDHAGESVPENAQDLTIFVQNLLEQMVRLRIIKRRYQQSLQLSRFDGQSPYEIAELQFWWLLDDMLAME